METALSSIAILLSATVLLGAYYPTLKKHNDELLHLLFWSNLLTYIAFATFFFLKHKTFYLFSFSHLETFMYDFTYTNLPLYLIVGGSTLGILLILESLSKHFPIAMIVAVSKVSIISSTIGYLILGNSFTINALIGISIVFIGALISGFPYISFKNPFKPLLELDKKLIIGAFTNALFASTISMITFICTAKFNHNTQEILHSISIHLHEMPFHTLTPIHFNIGSQFAVSLMLFFFIKFYRKHTRNILRFFIDNPFDVLKTTFFFAAANFFYYWAFDLIDDKTLIASVYKLYIPMTLIISYFMLHAKPKKPQLIGAALIVFGAFYSIIF